MMEYERDIKWENQCLGDYVKRENKGTEWYGLATLTPIRLLSHNSLFEPQTWTHAQIRILN